MFCHRILSVVVIILPCLPGLAGTADEGSSGNSTDGSNGNNVASDSSTSSTVIGGSNNMGSATQPPRLSYTFDMSLTRREPERVPWGYANARCKAKDVRRRLPVLKDAASWNSFLPVVKAINNQASGKDTQPVSVVPLGAYKLNDEWYWLDGTKMADGVTNWQDGQPNGTSVPENCVALNLANGDVGYSDVECSLGFSFICQYDKAKPAGKMHNDGYNSATMSTPSDCATGWDSAGGACYKEPDASVTIATPDEGAAACAKLDPKARLPEFYNSNDYDGFIRYVGTKVDAEHRNIPLGFRNNGTDFVNSDGKAYFLFWNQDEPADGKTCTFANDLNGYMWSAMDCTEKGVIFCQLDSRTVQIPVQVVSSGSGNSLGFNISDSRAVPKNVSASVQTNGTVSTGTGGGGDGSGSGNSSTGSDSNGSTSPSTSGGSNGSSGGSSGGSTGGGSAGSPHSGSSFKTLNTSLFLSSIAVAVVNVCRLFSNF